MPLVIHAASSCDVCLEPYDFSSSNAETQPHAIACGHVFCGGCLRSLAQRRCPLCRSIFLPDGIRKLHVDPTQQAIAGTPRPSIVEVEDGDSPSIRATKFREDFTHFLLEPRDPSRRMREYFVEVHRWLRDQPLEEYRDIRAQYLCLWRYIEILNRQIQQESEEKTELADLRVAKEKAEADCKDIQSNFDELTQRYAGLLDRYDVLQENYTTLFQKRSDRSQKSHDREGHFDSRSGFPSLKVGTPPDGGRNWELSKEDIEQQTPFLSEDAVDAIKRLGIDPYSHPMGSPETLRRRETYPQPDTRFASPVASMSRHATLPYDGYGERKAGKAQETVYDGDEGHSQEYAATKARVAELERAHAQYKSTPYFTPRSDIDAQLGPSVPHEPVETPQFAAQSDAFSWPPYEQPPLPAAPELRRHHTSGSSTPGRSETGTPQSGSSRSRSRGAKAMEARSSEHTEAPTPRARPMGILTPSRPPDDEVDSLWNNLQENWRTQFNDFFMSSSPQDGGRVQAPQRYPPKTAPATTTSFSYQNDPRFRPGSSSSNGTTRNRSNSRSGSTRPPSSSASTSTPQVEDDPFPYIPPRPPSSTGGDSTILVSRQRSDSTVTATPMMTPRPQQQMPTYQGPPSPISIVNSNSAPRYESYYSLSTSPSNANHEHHRSSRRSRRHSKAAMPLMSGTEGQTYRSGVFPTNAYDSSQSSRSASARPNRWDATQDPPIATA